MEKDWTQCAWRSQLILEEQAPWFGGCFIQQPLIQLHGKVNANVYKNLFWQHMVHSLQAFPNHPTIFMQDKAPCHTAKQVKHFCEVRNIEIMKCQPTVLIWNHSRIFSGSSETYWSYQTLEEMERRVEQDQTRATWATGDVLWVQMCCSNEGPLHFLIIFESYNHQNCNL